MSPSSYSFDAHEDIEVTVTFATGAVGTGSITLTGSGGGSDVGDYTISVEAPPAPSAAGLSLRNGNRSNLDRGLCLTAGAGEASGISCGDLIVTHGMPAYRALGRDRTISLLYNSAASTGLVLVAADVTQPAGTALPNSFKAILTVGAMKDSARYVPVTPGQTQQIVLGRGITGLSTGVYPMTLLVRNEYTSSSLDTVVSGSVLVVNRSASEYGKGWSLLGVEQALTDPNDSTRRVWVAGDASIRVYQRGNTLTSGMLSQSGITGFNPGGMVDGDTLSNGWHTDASAAGAWIRADLSIARTVTTLGSYAGYPMNAIYDVQYSDDAIAWRTVYAGYRPQTGWSRIYWAPAGAHRYWRLLLTNTPGVGAWMNELSLGSQNVFYGAPGDAPDSLVRFDTLGTKWYRRNLKHGAAVVLDATGRHAFTRNRVGARTLLTWTTVAGQTRLSTVAVPPNDATSRNYRLYWNGTTALLDSILDPGNRRLKTTQSSGVLASITDPDDQVTRFKYVGTLLTQRTYPRKGMKGDSAYTTFGYANNARVTSVTIQTDSAATSFAATVFTPWDEKGLALPFGGNSVGAPTSSAGLPTRIDGPLPGLGDAADIWVESFGQPSQITDLGLNTITRIRRTDPLNPALATSVAYPHPATAGDSGLVVRLTWSARGNLTEERQITSHVYRSGTPIGFPDRLTRYTYSALFPDSPDTMVAPGGIKTTYRYNGMGLPDSVVDPHLLRTAYAYDSSTGPFRGVLTRIIAGNDTLRFLYNTDGNMSAASSPINAWTSYESDALGRVIATYDPYGWKTGFTVDPMNRITRKSFYVQRQNHPGGLMALPPGYTGTDGTPLDAWWGPTLNTDFRFTPSGQLDSVADPGGVTRRFRYDARGLPVREIDEFNQAKTVFYGITGRVDSVLTRAANKVRYHYDASNRRDSVMFGSRTFTYDTATAVIQGDTVAYTFDLLGRVLTARNRRGTIKTSYYADGSIESKMSSLASRDGFGNPLPNTWVDSLYFSYDVSTGARNRMIMVVNPGGAATRDSVLYTYNSAGDLGTLQACFSQMTVCRQFTFTYDSLGRRKTITYPSSAGGAVVTYTFNKIGVLTGVTGQKSSNPVNATDRFDFHYGATSSSVDGRVSLQRLGCDSYDPSGDNVDVPCGSSGNEKWTQSSYNVLGQLLVQKTLTNGFSPFEEDTMRYDKSGNMISKSHLSYSGATYVLNRDDFAMLTGSNRLGSSTRTGPTSWSITYNSDSDGTRLTQIVSPYTNNTALNQRAWTYDVLSRQIGYAYIDVVNNQKVLRADPDGCWYDPEGRAYRSCDPLAPFMAFDGDNVIRVAGGWRFIHGPGTDDLLMGRITVGTIKNDIYFVTDRSGRELVHADSTGAFPSSFWTNTGMSDYRFAGLTVKGSTFDAARMSNQGQSGVSMFRNRSYDSRSGRWLQEDPIGIAGGINLYQFNGNNPVAFTDPFGLRPDTVEVQEHKVLGKWHHASIRITPDNQARWRADPRFGRDSQGRATLTLGAGPGLNSSGYSLISNLNREKDAKPHPAGPVVASGTGEDAVISSLLAADANYKDNLPYAFFPAQSSGAYNSNSYVSGILRAVGLPVPTMSANLPGYDHPVPASSFSGP